MRRALPLLVLGILFASPLRAAGLTKIERSIRQEPTYQSKTPRYCLLVFGPGAKTRVWLVLDGKTLYVDRNGNGDLTEDGEKVAAKKGLDILEEEIFEVDEIHDGARTHKKFSLRVYKAARLVASRPELKEKYARLPEGRGCSLTVDVEVPGWKGNGEGGRIQQLVSSMDTHGFLVFAAKPHNAPVIHFGGPLQMYCRRQLNRLMVGSEDELFLSLGTPGLGDGTTAYLIHEGTVPENVYPRLEITYPPLKPGEPPLKRLYELKARC